MTTDSRLHYLFRRYFDKSASPREREELMDLLSLLSDEQIAALMRDAFDGYHPASSSFTPSNRDAILQKLFGRDAEPHIDQLPREAGAGEGYGNGTKRLAWRKWAAAAVLLLSFAAGLQLFLTRKSAPRQEPAGAATFHQDVAPGGHKAVLKLADGRKIPLDSLEGGILARQGNASIRKLEGGLISYELAGGEASGPLYNELSTPQGGQYRLTLPDGSRVWLNAASSIRYPAVFGEGSRDVEITGEVYFEVASDPRRPFNVRLAGQPAAAGKDMKIRVLGTHFNVKAYSGEEAIETTLLEGLVEVSLHGEGRRIRPGQQARIAGGTEPLRVLDQVNLQEIMAWKEGYFQFENATIGQIMTEVARWYDVEVVYANPVSSTFTVLMLPRNLPVSRLLELLELTGNVKFNIEGRRIIVGTK